MKTQLKDLEVNVIRHCNLACLSCNHGSAIAKQEWMNPLQLDHDLNILNQYAHWELCMIQGGEPTIRKDLDEFMVIIKQSGIADTVGILTNGTLLETQPPSFWNTAKLVNLLVRISVYPILTQEQIDFAKAKCAEFNLRLEIGPLTTHFMKMFKPHTSAEVIQETWDKCPWKQCWTVHNGWLYRCPTSAFFPKQFPEMYDKPNEHMDGWKLDDPLFHINNALARITPLATCSICYGHGTERVEWGQSRSKEEWIAKSTI